MKTTFLLTISLLILSTCVYAAIKEKVAFKNDENGKKVEVFIGGKLFTAFIYPDNMEKQTLYPIMTASGKIITRGYPMNPRPFERTDHPHHVGLWFNFGDVNGLDFWNNSFAIKAADKPKYGSVKFQKIVSENPKKGELVTSAEWVDINNKVLLDEVATYFFSGTSILRIIERTSKLTAKQQVTFTENKEGLIGLRVDRAFEEPATKPEKFLDSKGIVTEVAALNNDGINGVYRNAEGVKGGAVWGKRTPWVALRARDMSIQNGPVQTAHLASSLAHLGNISYRLNRQLEFDNVAERFIGEGEAEANSMLTKDYRAPYILPEIV